jgi:hypothetical protein
MSDSSISFSLANLAGADKAPLFCQYPGQSQPQPAYITLSEDGDVSADYSGDIGGTSSRVWHMLDITWPVSAYAHPVVLAKMLQSADVVALFDRIHAGHSVAWDGSNHRGSLTDDAQAASDALESLLAEKFSGGDPDTCVQIWSADDWLFTSCTLTQHWDSQPLADAVKAIQDQADIDGVVLNGDIEGALLDQAARGFDEDGDDELTPVHLAALVAAGRITQSQADARQATAD